MTGYIFLFCSVLFLAVLSRKKKNTALILSFFLMTLFVGLRYKVGTDYENYSLIYETESTYMEPAFNSLVTWLNSKHLQTYWLFLVMAAITYFFMFAGLKEIKEAKVPLTLFMLSVCTLGFNCNGIRQAVANSIFLFSFHFITGKKILPYVICILAASTFHASVLIALPLYFILNRQLSAKLYCIIYLVSFAFLFLDLETLTGPFAGLIENYQRYENYIEDRGHDEGYLGPGVILEILNYIVLIAFSLFGGLHKKYTALFNIILIAAVLMNMRVSAPIFVRVQEYFSIFINILIPILLFEKNVSKYRQLLSAYFGLSIGLSTIVYLFFTPGGRMYPYHDILGLF